MVGERSIMFYWENLAEGAKSESNRRKHHRGGSGKARR